MTTKVSTTVEWNLLAVMINHNSRNQVIKVLKQVYIVIIHTTTSVRWIQELARDRTQTG